MKIKLQNPLLLVALLVLLAAPAVGSSAWVEYSRDKDGDVYSYKVDNVIKDKAQHIIQLSDKQVYSDKNRNEQIRLRKGMGKPIEGWHKLSHIVILSEIDCNKGKEKPSFYTIYNTEGKVLFSDSFEKPQWEYIVPRSLHDTLRKKVCR